MRASSHRFVNFTFFLHSSIVQHSTVILLCFVHRSSMNSQTAVAKDSFGTLSLELRQKIYSLALNIGARRDRIRTAQILGSLNRASRSALCAPLIDWAIRMQNNIDNILTPGIAALSPLLAPRDFYRHFQNPKVSVAVLKVEIFLQRCRDEDNARREVAWLLYFVAWIESKEHAENAKVVRKKEAARKGGIIWGTGTTRNRITTANTGITRDTGSARNTEVWWVTHSNTGASWRSSRDSILISAKSNRAVYSTSIGASQSGDGTARNTEVWWLPDNYIGASPPSSRNSSPVSARSNSSVYSPSMETSQSGEHGRVEVEDSMVLTASNNLPMSQIWSPCMEAGESVEHDQLITEGSRIGIRSKDVRKPKNWKNKAKAWLSRTVKQKISTTACKLFRSHRKR